MERILKQKHGSKEWLLQRWRDEQGRCVFGASDIPALMNASPYKTRAELFADKLNEPQVQPDSAIFRRGNLLEKPLLEAASEQLGVGIFTPEWVYRDDRLSISLDGVNHWESPSVVVEAKTTTRYSIYDSNDLPIEWLWQGYAQQSVMECPVWFSVLDRDLKLSVVELPENGSAISVIRKQTELFGEWVDNNTPPLDELNNFTADDIARIWKVSPTIIELDQAGAQLVADLEFARTASRRANEVETHIKDTLARLMLGNEIGVFGGQKIVSWTQQAGKASLDTALLRSEQPDLVKKYEKQGNPYRVMRTHKPKGELRNE